MVVLVEGLRLNQTDLLWEACTVLLIDVDSNIHCNALATEETTTWCLTDRASIIIIPSYTQHNKSAIDLSNMSIPIVITKR